MQIVLNRCAKRYYKEIEKTMIEYINTPDDNEDEGVTNDESYYENLDADKAFGGLFILHTDDEFQFAIDDGYDYPENDDYYGDDDEWDFDDSYEGN